MITVSAIVPTYNRARYLPEALDSLLNQTRPPDEVLVVSDGSCDETDEVASSYGLRIRYLRLDKNIGKPSALNHAIPLTKGSHIWIFDDDDIALPDALQSHVALLGEDDAVDFSYSTNYVFEGAGDIWDKSRWKLKHLPAWPAEEFFIHHAFSMHAMMQGMLIPKHCYDEVGYFDPTLFRCQDLEMVLRLACHFTAANLQKPTFVLREHSGVRGPEKQQHEASQRAAVWLQYQRRIYRKMHEDYPLSAYLPHPPRVDVPIVDNRQRALALLQRGAIMLQQGLTREASSDLRAGLGLLESAAPIPDQSKRILSYAFDVDAWRLSGSYGFILEMGRLPVLARAASLRTAIIKGIYWALRRAVRQRRWGDTRRSAVMLAMSLLLLAPMYHRRGARVR